MPAGFVTFVLKLQKGRYTYQFGQYAWTHMILLVVFIPSSFFVSNIFDGLMWFLLPCSLVIINDIGAYICGGYLKKSNWAASLPACLPTAQLAKSALPSIVAAFYPCDGCRRTCLWEIYLDDLVWCLWLASSSSPYMLGFTCVVRLGTNHSLHILLLRQWIEDVLCQPLKHQGLHLL